jgi:hypothetical protein
MDPINRVLYSKECSNATGGDLAYFLTVPMDTVITNPELSNIIDNRTAEKFVASNITSIAQLIGICMTLRTADYTINDWKNRICQYLINIRIRRVSACTLADCVCERLQCNIPYEPVDSDTECISDDESTTI